MNTDKKMDASQSVGDGTEHGDAPTPVWVNGQWFAQGEACIAADDMGFSVGLAVFETLLWDDSVLHFAERHWQRMAVGAQALGLDWPVALNLGAGQQVSVPAACATYTEGLLTHHAEQCLAVRATLTRGRPQTAHDVENNQLPSSSGPQLILTARTVEPTPAEGVGLVLSDRRLEDVRAQGPDNSEGSHNRGAAIKSNNRISYTLARESARSAGFWDALFVSEAGDLAETSVANVFVRHGREVRTPELASGCLPGVMRGLVLEILASSISSERLAAKSCSVREASIELDSLKDADEIFLTNTTGRVVGVKSVEGIVQGLPGPEGELVTTLRRAIRDREPGP